MLRAGAFDNVLDMQLASFTAVEGLHTLAELRAEPPKLVNVVQEVLADFVLRRSGKAFHLRNRFLKYANHMR